jgi:predicted PurR-regulated permease PerM
LAYLKGQLLVALAMGAAIWVISSAIGLSWALLIGLVAGLLQTVPQIGGLLAVVPAAIVALWPGSSVLPVNWVFMLIVIGVFSRCSR